MKTSTKIAIASAIAVAAYVSLHRETPQVREQRYLAHGNELFNAGEYEKARVEYRNAAKLMPLDPEISYRWGMVDEAQGDIRNAFANYLRAEQQNPHYAPALLKLAHYQLVVEQYGEVQKRLDIVLADDSANAEAHALKASLLLHQHQYDDVRKEIALATAADPGNITAASVLTGLYIAEGDMAKAEAAVDDGIAHNPKDLSLLLLKVKMFEKPLNLEKINQAYNDIIKLQPSDVQLRTVLADIYMQGGRLDDAETTLRSATHDMPDNWDLKHQLVMFLGRYRSVDVAEKEIQSMMQSDSDHTELYFWLTELYIDHNQIDKAVALLEQIVARDDSDRQSLLARSSLARINFRKGNKELAEQLVNAVLAKAPTNPEALYVRASIATDEARYQNAVNDLRLIIRNNPKNADALQLLAEVLLLQGYTDLAIETLNQVVELNPANSPAQVRLAQMYNQNHDPEHGMKILDAVTKLDPGYPVAWESMARLAIGMNDFKTANLAITHLQGFKGQEQVAQFLTGQLAQASGDKSVALGTYAEIIKKDPKSPLAERAVFEMVEKHHSPEELTATLQLLNSLNTDSAYINTIIGETYMALEKPDLALAAFDKAIANHPVTQDAYLNRAKMYYDAGDEAKAVELLKLAHDANTSDVRADLFLADVDTKNAKFADAIQRYQDLLVRFPDLDVAANNMASLIADNEYTDAAQLEKAAKAVEHFAAGKNQNFIDTLSWVYYRQAKFTQAESLMEHNSSLGPLSPNMHYHYGAILIARGNKPKAKDELQKATLKEASPEIVKKAQELLKDI